MNPFPRWYSSTLILSFALLFPTLILSDDDFAFRPLHPRPPGNTTFTFVNRCNYTVWPAIQADSGKLPTTGFELRRESSQSFQVPKPTDQTVSFWSRTGCNFDWSGFGSCLTGDCGSGKVECAGAGPSSPAIVGVYGFDHKSSSDFYYVSLEHGFNVPMSYEAVGGSGSCDSPGCFIDLNQLCPPELVFGDAKGCQSPCQAFGNAEYCCSGPYGYTGKCKPNIYTEMFKAACPTSFSYARLFDDDDNDANVFTCTGADYVVTFCPSSRFSSS